MNSITTATVMPAKGSIAKQPVSVTIAAAMDILPAMTKMKKTLNVQHVAAAVKQKTMITNAR
jgi:hypothetical protein